MVKIHRSTRPTSRWARAALMVALAFSVERFYGQDEKDDPAVYYLSPQVLTRTRMTPKRLKTEAFRVVHLSSLASEVRSVSAIRSAGRKVMKGDIWRHDFRLCVSVVKDETCFSADAKVAYANDGSFLLSASEERDVLTLFRKLDSLANKQK